MVVIGFELPMVVPLPKVSYSVMVVVAGQLSCEMTDDIVDAKASASR